PGSGGGNDIASLANMIVAMPHEKKRFVEKVDFVTSPGYLDGGATRRDSGLITGSMHKVITDLCIFGFDDDTRRMKVEALHTGVKVEDVLENTGFTPIVPDRVDVTEPPTEEELAILNEIDPDRMYLH
ncbi:MAG: CoA-transferase, partial [Nitrospinota bacterium]|nr:CoA-transferase [Nitrospinota bacterium]